MLGATYEFVTLPDDIAARLEGKSSLGRLGLLTHSTAGFIDPGFAGHVALGAVEHGDAADQALSGMKIGQLCFFRLQLPSGAPLRFGSHRLALSGTAGADAESVAPELQPAHHPGRPAGA